MKQIMAALLAAVGIISSSAALADPPPSADGTCNPGVRRPCCDKGQDCKKAPAPPAPKKEKKK